MSPFSGLAETGVPKSLGQTEQTWYSRAKTAVAEYDNLWARTQRIAAKAYRDQLTAQYHGNPNDPEGALYRRNSVASNLAEAEGYTPINYLVFGESRVQSRVEKLESWNRDFKRAVKYGEDTYGVLEEPEVIERTVTVQKAVTPSWVMPVVILGGVVLLGSLFFRKK